jgi:hypothetical protein
MTFRVARQWNSPMKVMNGNVGRTSAQAPDERQRSTDERIRDAIAEKTTVRARAAPMNGDKRRMNAHVRAQPRARIARAAGGGAARRARGIVSNERFGQTRSSASAMPCPTPMHIVASA